MDKLVVQVDTGMIESVIVRCELNVADFPFDTQTCVQTYRSQSNDVRVPISQIPTLSRMIMPHAQIHAHSLTCITLLKDCGL